MVNDLLNMASKLGNPNDYYDGFRIRTGFVPDNILAVLHNKEKGFVSNVNNCDYHHRFILIVPIIGIGKLGLGEEIFDLFPGNGIVVFPYEIHYYPHLSEDCEWLYITFETQDSNVINPLKNSPRILNENINSLLQNFLSTYHDCKNGTDTVLHLSQLIKNVIESMIELPLSKIESTDQSHVSKTDDIISKVNQYVQDNIQHAITIFELSKHLSISQSYLSAVFRKQYGLTLGQYVLKLKIDFATKLLLTTDNKIIEIAPKCGFESPISFSRAFKKTMLVTPKQYRINARNKTLTTN